MGIGPSVAVLIVVVYVQSLAREALQQKFRADFTHF